MRIKETLNWIIDYNDSKLVDDEKYKLNIEFVHSLGLKCDCVGWCKLDLSHPRLDEILCKIKAYCKSMNCRVRAYYERAYADYESDWYELIPTCFNDNTVCDREEYKSIRGKAASMISIRAYREAKSSPKEWYESVFVPERFRDFCIRNNLSDVDFCWVRDKGKYRAEQYFFLYSDHNVKRILSDKGLRGADKKRINTLGGAISKVADVVDKFQNIELQDCYLESDLPHGGIVHAYVPKSFSYCGRNVFLIHKSLAEIFLKEKAIPESSLRPALVVKEIPGGYVSEKTEVMDRPTDDYFKKSISEYEILKKTERPIRKVTEKDALKRYKGAKSERKEDFFKPLSKALADEALSSKHAPLFQYYKIANGAYLSDEYFILPYKDAVAKTESFNKAIKEEELSENVPCGIVIAKCADGDIIILADDGRVIRLSHEEPTVCCEWESLHSFICDVIGG